MHNDGVAQGLAEVPFMQDVRALGCADDRNRTGYACFTNRKKENGKDDKKSKMKTTAKKREKGQEGQESGRLSASCAPRPQTLWRKVERLG